MFQSVSYVRLSVIDKISKKYNTPVRNQVNTAQQHIVQSKNEAEGMVTR